MGRPHRAAGSQRRWPGATGWSARWVPPDYVTRAPRTAQGAGGCRQAAAGIGLKKLPACVGIWQANWRAGAAVAACGDVASGAVGRCWCWV